MPSIDFFGERYTEPSDVVLVATRAVASEVNFNYDQFTESEMERAAPAYADVDNVFVDHTYTRTDDDADRYEDGIDRSRSRGRVVASHYEDGEIYLLIAVSKEWANLVDAILTAKVNAVSMGCDCRTRCSVCGGEFDDLTPCPCGSCPTLIGSTAPDGTKVHDVLFDIDFYEISIVFTPASPSALFYEVVAD